MVLCGNFQVKLNSDYNYRKGTIVEIEGVRYDVVQEIMDAIAPILVKERELVKKELEEDE